MDVIVRSNNNPVNYMTALVSELINDLVKLQGLRVVKVCLVSDCRDCQSGYSCHQQDKQVLGGCLCNQEGSCSINIESVNCFVGWMLGGTNRKNVVRCAVK